MTAAHEFDYGTLSWVKAEIDQTLDQARKALEVYADDPQDDSQLRFCINHLHQVHGTLQMVEIYGAALAAEEMESLAVALSAGEAANRDEALEVLMRGILQLPDYLERLQKGQKDMPMVLLPLLNDLRAARRANLLSENALFSPDLDVNAPAVKNTGDLAEDLPARAGRLRHTYHMGLLGLFRDREREASLTRLAAVIQQLRQVTRTRQTAQLLWVAGGLTEALKDGGTEPSVAVKLLLGHVDREIKRIIDFGEDALVQVPADDLIKNLLYYVGRSRSDGPQVGALKEAFRLEEQLPDQDAVEEARAELGGPNAALVKTVTDALRETLDQVKEQLDVFVRGSERKGEDLKPLHDMLRQLADTLVMLGVGAERQTVQAQMAMLEAMINGEQEIADEPLMELAGQLLSVEAALESLAEGGGGTARDEQQAQTAHPPQVVASVLAEARAEVARIKDAVGAYSKTPHEPHLLNAVPSALQGVRGSLAMLDMTRAAELVSACRQYIQQELIDARAVPEAAALDSLADALTSIEYYLESVSERWGSPRAILEAASETIDGLARGEPGVDLVLEGDAPAAVPAADPAAAPEATRAEDTEPEAPEAPLDELLDAENMIEPAAAPAPGDGTEGIGEWALDWETAESADPEVVDVGPESPETRGDSSASDTDLELEAFSLDFESPTDDGRSQETVGADSDESVAGGFGDTTDFDLELDAWDRSSAASTGSGVAAATAARADGPELGGRSTDGSAEAAVSRQDSDTHETPSDTWSLDGSRGDSGGAAIAPPEADPVPGEPGLPGADETFGPAAKEAGADMEETPVQSAQSASETWSLDGPTFGSDDEGDPVRGEMGFGGADETFGPAAKEAGADMEETPVQSAQSASEAWSLDGPTFGSDDEGDPVRGETGFGGADETFGPAATEAAPDIEQTPAQGAQSASEAWSLDGPTLDSDDEGQPALDDLDLHGANETFGPAAAEAGAEADTPTQGVGRGSKHRSLDGESDEPEVIIEPLSAADLDWDDVESPLDAQAGGPPHGDAAPYESAALSTNAEDVSPARLGEVLDLWLLEPSDTTIWQMLETVILALSDTAVARLGDDAVAGPKAELQAAVQQVSASGGADLDAIRLVYAKRDAFLQAIGARDALDAAGLAPDFDFGDPFQEQAAAAESDAPAATARGTPDSSGPEPASPTPEIDDEIIEIFLEEAAEELANISRLLPAWRSNPSDHDTRGDLRRSFHTLKGSGRLVGAGELGEFAWAFENMLNRVIDGSVEAAPAIFELLDKAREALPGLFEFFKSGRPAGPDIFRLMEQADALSRGDAPVAGGEVTTADPEPAVGESAAGAGAPGSPPGPDPVLLEIYRKESEGHLQTLRDTVAKCRAQGSSCPVSEALARAVHTLRGSSRTAGVKVVADINTDLEHYVRLLQERGLPLEAAALDALDESVMLVTRTMDLLEQGEDLASLTADAEGLRARVAALHEAAESRRPVAPADTPQAPPAEASAAGTSSAPAVAEYDDELLEIFLEEGVEILDSSDQTLHLWLSNPGDAGLLEQLQRDLHTLKGGARMAGVTAVGDLSHSLESLLTAVVDGHLPVSAHMFDILQQAQDRLVAMLEQARQREPVTPANDLLALLDGFLGRELPALDEDSPADHEANDRASPAPAPAADDPEAAAAPEHAPATAAPAAGGELIPRAADAPAPVDGELEPATPAEEGERRRHSRAQQEQVRVRADLLDNLVNFAGEVSIYRSRLEQQVNVFRFDLHELDETTARLRDQLRNFEIETEAQIQYRYEDSSGNKSYEEFDPLEFDRFTTMQQLSRSMMESLNDLDSLRNLLGNATRESETLLLQQARVNTDLQEGLMRARMVPFGSQAPRLRRIVRQACGELGKRAELRIVGEEHELDRQVLDRIMAPLEHMLRNAVAHGIEAPGVRRNAGKSESGTITLEIGRDGSEVLIRVSDDGGGIDFEAIQDKAVRRGLIAPDAHVNEPALLDMILESGFSTAGEVTQIAGRGVGMDVVNSEIKQLGGTLHIDSIPKRSTRFTIRLPLTLSVTRALVVSIGESQYAVPLLSVQGVERLSHEDIQALLVQDTPTYEWVGEPYRFLHLGSIMGVADPMLPGAGRKLPVLITRSGDQRAALLVEGLHGSREIVVKSVGPQLSTLRGISGATITGEGDVQLILDLGLLTRLGLAQDRLVTTESVGAIAPRIEQTTVLVVDDSITVRKVTTRLLERNGYKVYTAKDGVDALAQLDEIQPDLILLDIEMPRMDGFELATNVRNTDRLRHIPIIMITSRVADKHRQRAFQIGVNQYMGKPFQEHDLLANITAEFGDREADRLR